jgi:hypothetical protein
MERASNGKYICQYNPECECEELKCSKCGWNPSVSARRQRVQRERSGLLEKKYKVSFTGYCEVWANSPEEAADKAENIDQQFFAHYDYDEPVCLEEENDELD